MRDDQTAGLYTVVGISFWDDAGSPGDTRSEPVTILLLKDIAISLIDPTSHIDLSSNHVSDSVCEANFTRLRM